MKFVHAGGPPVGMKAGGGDAAGRPRAPGITPTLCAVLFAVAANTASAANTPPPMALVMDVQGKTTPAVDKHQELSADSRITLAKGARLSVLHYQKCTIYTVRSGAIKVTDAGVDAGTAKVETQPGPCPRVQRVTVGGQPATSGVVLSRAITPPRPVVSVAATDVIVMTGPLASRALSAEILDAGGKTVPGAASIRASSIRLAGAHALTTGNRYELRVNMDGVERQVVVPLAIVDVRSEGPLILRFE